MSSTTHRVVRVSKFRNVYGTNWKRDLCYDNIKVSKSAWDATFCAVNPKFLAVITESAGGGAFIVLPIKQEKVGRMKSDHPVVSGHKGPVLDIAWCPHDDNMIVSGSEDCSAKIWNIPDEGLASTVTEPLVALLYHQRRVGLVLWHPTAENVLLTAGSDNLVVIWNASEAEPAVVIECHPDVVYSASWNWDGSKLLTTCKDKKIRIINPRSGEVEEEAICHEGTKACHAIYLKNGLVFTTGFSKVSERQYSLREPTQLGDPMVMTEVDTSNGVMFPFYDPDTNMIYLCGKGDSVIRYFEVTPEPPYVHYINTFQTPDPQRGIGMMPKRGCDVHSCEITRFYRLNSSGLCQVVSMTVPRKSELFQEDLYPDTISPVAALSAEDWFAGGNENPITMSLKSGISISCRLYEDETDVVKKRRLSCDIPTPLEQHMRLSRSNSLSHTAVTKTLSLPPNVKSPTKDNDVLLEEIARLKKLLAAQEERVRVLESSNHEKRIHKLESLQLDKRIRHLESFNIEELTSSLEMLKTKDRIEVANTTPLKCANCQSLMGVPRHSTPSAASPSNERANFSVFETFTTTVVPQLPFSGAVTMLTNMLTNPINVFGNQLPSPLAAAQSLSSLPPLKALSTFSKWIPNQSMSSLSTTLISSLVVNRSSNSPPRNADSCTSSS